MYMSFPLPWGKSYSPRSFWKGINIICLRKQEVAPANQRDCNISLYLFPYCHVMQPIFFWLFWNRKRYFLAETRFDTDLSTIAILSPYIAVFHCSVGQSSFQHQRRSLHKFKSWYFQPKNASFCCFLVA